MARYKIKLDHTVVNNLRHRITQPQRRNPLCFKILPLKLNLKVNHKKSRLEVDQYYKEQSAPTPSKLLAYKHEFGAINYYLYALVIGMLVTI